MRILLITEMYPPDADGGQEVNAQKLAEALISQGHDVAVVTAVHRARYSGPPESRPYVHRILGHAPFLENNEPRAQVLRRTWLYALEVWVHKRNKSRLRQLAAQWKPDVAYIFGTSRIGLGFSVELHRLGIPSLWHQGGSNLERRLSQRGELGRLAKFFRSLESEELQADFRYVAYVSQFLADETAKYELPTGVELGSELRPIISRGIDFDVFVPIPERYTTGKIVMAGRIGAFKGYHVAIEACALLSRRRPDLQWTLEIFGEADDEDTMGHEKGSVYLAKLKSMMTESSLVDRIFFRGGLKRGDLLNRFEGSAIFVSASNCGEAFANTIIEAGGKGNVLVVSDDGSAREVVLDGETGLVYPPGDAVALSEALERVLDDPQLAFRLSTASAERLDRHFTLDAVVRATVEVFEEMIKRESSRRTSR
ncbi:MAG: glycosyltransferase family 4 protein [Methanoregulaceae archaeon]|nr:glycosyltransferase family 4 protein [Methanoregulaceae archaeon]